MDTGTICLLGIIFVLALVVISRLMVQNKPFIGNTRPEYDDPNIGGQGSFGRPDGDSDGEESPRYNDPNIQGRGSFGRPRGGRGVSSPAPRSQPPKPTKNNDDPNISGRGSFGRDKD